MEALKAALTEYVNTLVKDGAIGSESVQQAFRTVHRHRFLEGWYHPEVSDVRVVFRPVEYDRDHPTPEGLREIYSNQALVTAVKHSMPTSSTSQPALVARMLELLDLRPGMHVLEIGTGTGYNAALLAEILGSGTCVSTIEYQEDVAQRARSHLEDEGHGDVRVVCGDGHLGVPDSAPFDRIVATVSCSDVSPHWLDQLSPEGLLLLPLRHGFSDPLVRIERDPADGEQAFGRIVDRSSFMPIQGTLAWANPWQSYGIANLPQEPTSIYPLPNGLASDRGTTETPLNQMEDRGLRFFLALSSRELWWSNRGYGLADPGSSSALILTKGGLEGYTASSDTAGLDGLYNRFVRIQDEWRQLGRPTTADYSLTFVPAARLEKPPEVPGREWIIVRPLYIEIVRLPERVRALEDDD